MAGAQWRLYRPLRGECDFGQYFHDKGCEKCAFIFHAYIIAGLIQMTVVAIPADCSKIVEILKKLLREVKIRNFQLHPAGLSV